MSLTNFVIRLKNYIKSHFDSKESIEARRKTKQTFWFVFTKILLLIQTSNFENKEYKFWYQKESQIQPDSFSWFLFQKCDDAAFTAYM